MSSLIVHIDLPITDVFYNYSLNSSSIFFIYPFSLPAHYSYTLHFCIYVSSNDTFRLYLFLFLSFIDLSIFFTLLISFIYCAYMFPLFHNTLHFPSNSLFYVNTHFTYFNPSLSPYLLSYYITYYDIHYI